MEREVGGGIGMGNTCKPLAVSFQCMTKSTTNKKKKKKKKENMRRTQVSCRQKPLLTDLDSKLDKCQFLLKFLLSSLSPVFLWETSGVAEN